MSEAPVPPQMSPELAAALGKLTPDQFVKLVESVAPKTPALPSSTSPDISELATALALAQGEMFSPVRNKHVTVTKRKGGTYDFRYSSLDVINDMIRLPLAQNGLSIMHICRPNARGELFLATRLQHKSGQFITSVMPLMLAPFVDDETGMTGPQRLGSMMTYSKRYQICALLSISSQEDDDANVAEGNMIIDHEYPVEPNAQMRVLQDRYARLVSAAANARDPAGVGEMLQRWQRGLEFWMRMKGAVDHNENFERLMTLIPEAINRVHHKILGECFRLGALASQAAEIEVVRSLWDSAEARSARAKMKELNPISYGLLFEHLRLQTARVERETEEAELRLAKEAQRQAIEQALDEEGSPFDGAELVQAATRGPFGGTTQEAVDQARGGVPAVYTEANPPDLSYRQVRDEFGEVISEILNEIQFARCYVEQFEDAADREALRQHNEDGLAWARKFVDAAVILMQGVGKEQWKQPDPAPIEAETGLAVVEPAAATAPPSPAGEPLIVDDPRQLALLPTVDAVTLHKTAKKTPDLSRYLRAVKISLEQVDAASVPAWEEANLPTVDGLPKATQLAIMALLVGRKQVLGVAA